VRGLRLYDGFVGLCSLRAKLLIGASNVAKRHGGLQRQRGSYLIEAMVWLGIRVVAGVASRCCGLRRQCLGGRGLRSSHSNNVATAHLPSQLGTYIPVIHPSVHFRRSPEIPRQLTMTIVHIVLFEWKSTASHEQVEEVSSPPNVSVYFTKSCTEGMPTYACLERQLCRCSLWKTVHHVFLGGQKQQSRGACGTTTPVVVFGLS
jgi:hypothetical protein